MAEKDIPPLDPKVRAWLEVNQKPYTEKKLWKKVVRWAKTAGKALIAHVVTLYYTATDPDTPRSIRIAIWGGPLGYFINPVDAIPDPVPVVGFTDDLGVLLAAIKLLHAYIKSEHYRQASERLKEWFGEDEPGPEGGPPVTVVEKIEG